MKTRDEEKVPREENAEATSTSTLSGKALKVRSGLRAGLDGSSKDAAYFDVEYQSGGG